jgi:hypothetical protein
LKQHTFQNFNHPNNHETATNPILVDDPSKKLDPKETEVQRSNLDINQFNNGVYSIESTLHQHGIVQEHLTVGASKLSKQRPSTNAF